MRWRRNGYAFCVSRAVEGAAGLMVALAAGVFAACGPVARIRKATPPVPESSVVPLATLHNENGAADADAGGWQPRPGQTWQWQLTGEVDTSIVADIYDVDLFDTPAETVARLHSLGRRVICYMSAGSYEAWRPDAAAFPPEVIGQPYAGWPDEWWLDIRQADALAPILEARLDLCRAKGFDGVEPDNVDAYQADTGFPLSAQDQLQFNRRLAQAAHARGLSIGLKNDPDQAGALVEDFDWALLEDCFAQGWCEAMAPFVRRGKLVVAVEYTDSGVDWIAACEHMKGLGLQAVLKKRDLDAWRQACADEE
jgi:hypothetical protein